MDDVDANIIKTRTSSTISKDNTEKRKGLEHRGNDF
jgi:hypothetical protein